MDGFAHRAIGVGKIPGRLRARISRWEVCPGCQTVGSMRRVTDAEDWAMLGQATVSRRSCGVCGAGVLERPKGYPRIGGTKPNRSRARRLLSR